jgi:hypothetical protein
MITPPKKALLVLCCLISRHCEGVTRSNLKPPFSLARDFFPRIKYGVAMKMENEKQYKTNNAPKGGVISAWN